MTYVGNNSSRYDGKDYLEKITKLKRDEEAEELCLRSLFSVYFSQLALIIF